MDYKYYGSILGMEQFGCVHDKTDFVKGIIYFTIPPTFTEEQLKRSSHAFKEMFGLMLKYKIKEKRKIMNDTIVIATDGGARPNPGIGGIGCVIQYKNLTKEISDAFKLTTNNRMEIMSVIYAFQFLNSKKMYLKCKRIQLFSDSQYVINTFAKKWINIWATNSWKNGTVKNVDLWQQLLDEIQFYEISWIWVKSHADNEMNNRCDQLATEAIQNGNYKIDIGY